MQGYSSFDLTNTNQTNKNINEYYIYDASKFESHVKLCQVKFK